MSDQQADQKDLHRRPQEETAQVWLDDLHWHKRAFRQSRFRWLPEHVLDVVTEHTGGQVEFTSLGDLRRIAVFQDNLSEYTNQIRLTMAEPLRQCQDILGGPDPVAEALGLGGIEVRGIIWGSAGQTPTATATTTFVLDGIPMCNPLIEAWELKQAARLYEAAYDVIEDTLCLLVSELSGKVPDTLLVDSAHELSRESLQERVEDADAARTTEGGKKTVPSQSF